jgi:hypothetical protein
MKFFKLKNFKIKNIPKSSNYFLKLNLIDLLLLFKENKNIFYLNKTFRFYLTVNSKCN